MEERVAHRRLCNRMHLFEPFYLPALATVKTDICLSPPLSPLHFTSFVLWKGVQNPLPYVFRRRFRPVSIFISSSEKKTDFCSRSIRVLALRGPFPLATMGG